MSANLTRIEFVLSGTVAGRPLTPETVDWPTLRGFLGEVEDFVKGDQSGQVFEDSHLTIEEGSLKIVFVLSALVTMNIHDDLTRLESNHDLSKISPRRAAVVEKWLRSIHRHEDWKYALLPEGKAPMMINRETNFENKEDHFWVPVEKYLTGIVSDLGGKGAPNVHLSIEGEDPLTISASRELLKSEEKNWLYHYATLLVRGQQHLITRKYQKLVLVEFVKKARKIDDEVLSNLFVSGRSAWKNIGSAAEWVDEIRGNPQ